MNDSDVLNLCKTCKTQYNTIKLYKYKGAVNYQDRHNYKNCQITALSNVNVSEASPIIMLPKSLKYVSFVGNSDKRMDGWWKILPRNC